MMEYSDVRKAVSQVVPGLRPLFDVKRKARAIKEKGRKKNYSQFNLRDGEWQRQERLLNTEQINSFLEISLRAQACPMPFNMDVWDGLVCVAEGQRIKTERGDIPIEEVRPGDRVLTFNEVTKQLEWKAVTNTSRTVRKNLVEIETEAGTVRVTGDHRVMTQRGWIKAEDLTDEDTLYTY